MTVPLNTAGVLKLTAITVTFCSFNKTRCTVNELINVQDQFDYSKVQFCAAIEICTNTKILMSS